MRTSPPLCALLLAAACSAPQKDYDRELPPGRMALRKIDDPSRIPDFANGFQNRDEIARSIQQSLAYLATPSSKSHYPYLDITHDRAVRSLRALQEVVASAPDRRRFHRMIVDRFEVYESVGFDSEGTVLFTAYCEPIYDGSLTPDAEFRFPLYRLPPDLLKAPDGTPLGRRTPSGGVEPYPTRKQIEESGLLKGLELVYLRDPVEAYIVHVQGSARIRLATGGEIRVGYAGKTDHPYRSVSQILLRDGRIRKSELSLRGVREFFKRHPELVSRYLHENPSYVFFTERQGGPYGSLNVPLTSGHSIATDKSVFPRAAPAFVVAANIGGRFMMDQDTGGAIRSAGRADLYLGSGPEAELRAGGVHQEGQLYYLFVK